MLRRVTRTLFLILSSLVGAQTTSAQERPAIRGMTLPEAVAYARTHQPSLLASQARIDAAKAAAEVPRAQWMPLVAATVQAYGGTTNNSTASYQASFGVDMERIGATPANAPPDWVPSASTVVAIGLHQEVYDFGRIAAEDATADAQTEVTRRQTDMARLDVDLAVTDAYFSVIAAREVLTSANQAVQRMRVDREATAAGVKSGLVEKVHLTLAEASLARAEAARIQAQGGLDGAQVVFAAITGVPDPRLDATGTPPTVGPLPELNHALEIARAHNPDLLTSEAALTGQHATTESIAARQRPDLQLTATVSGRGGGATPSSGPELTGDGGLPIVPNYIVGLVFSWPLYDAVIRRQSDASRQLEIVRRLDVANATLQVNAGVQQAYVRAQVADQAIPALERSVEAAQENNDQARVRFKAGLGTSVDVAYAEDLLVQAQIQLAVGRYEQARARARLARAMAENP